MYWMAHYENSCDLIGWGVIFVRKQSLLHGSRLQLDSLPSHVQLWHGEYARYNNRKLMALDLTNTGYGSLYIDITFIEGRTLCISAL